MLEFARSLYLTDILNKITQALLVPDIVFLILFMLYGLFEIGSILVETFTQRINFKAKMPQLLTKLTDAAQKDITRVIETSGLLKRQRIALDTLWEYRRLPGETHIALAKRLLSTEELRYGRIVGRTNTASKLAPMLGLMGTLIPLGPGIVALGQGDTTTLASSIGVAFDTTVAGLSVAVITLIVSKIRKNWYENYMVSLESAMTCIIEKVAVLRETGTLDDSAKTGDVETIAAHAAERMKNRE